MLEPPHTCTAFFLAMVLTTFDPMTVGAKPILESVAFSSISGWSGDNHAEALVTFQRSCAEILQEGRAFKRPVKFGGTRDVWEAVCRKGLQASDARIFFEENFAAFQVHDPQRPQGLFTGYFEPEAAGSRTPSASHTVPIYRKPDDLVVFDGKTEAKTGLKYGRLIEGKPAPYFTRKEIEQGELSGRGLEIAWLKDWADAFFIHIQGSGRVRLPDGTIVRLAYAGKSGQPYTGIGGLLVDRGAFTREQMSMQATRAWMAQNPKAARELMWQNRSFIFFQEVEADEPGLGPPGAQRVRLTPQRSLAVDRGIWMFGTPIWLDTTVPLGLQAKEHPFRRLMIAQDTGTAIRGYVRGDVFWGSGEQAALTAGHMKSSGRMTVFLPKQLADQLLGAQ